MLPRRSLVVLLPLYFAQGMPFGFQATALPVYLREQGVSLSTIGFLGLLSLPWAVKFLWAPLVDRYGRGYRAWIMPLQVLLAAITLAAAYIPAGNTPPLLLAVFLMNLLAATQDIAVDGLAVRTLTSDDLGAANAIQVVGYKLGMLTGGGLLVWASGTLGWPVVFYGMSALMMVVFAITIVFVAEPNTQVLSEDRLPFAQIMKQLGQAAKLGGIALVLVIATAKIGEQMIETMWKPFLVDRGISKGDIGLWQGTYGMTASILGSLAGALLCRRFPLHRALLIAAALRVPGLVGQLWISQTTSTSDAIIAITVIEHFFIGVMTTALFAYMMSRVDRRIAATHYTLLASIEVFGKSPGALVSGVLAERAGYTVTFAIGVALSVAYVFVVAFAAQQREPVSSEHR